MPTVNRPLIGVSNDDEHYKALVKRQTKNDKNHNTSRNYALIPIGSIVAVHWEFILKHIEKQTPMNQTLPTKNNLKTLKKELIWVTHTKKAKQQIPEITLVKQTGGWTIECNEVVP